MPERNLSSRKFTSPPFDPYAQRNRVIRQRNVALGLVLGFFAVLFFAITVVKMKHVQMPHIPRSTSVARPATGSTDGH